MSWVHLQFERERGPNQITDPNIEGCSKKISTQICILAVWVCNYHVLMTLGLCFTLSIVEINFHLIGDVLE